MKEEYKIVLLKDTLNGKTLGAIYLNNKHTISDLQNAINIAKIDRAYDIMKYGDDWSYISEELDKNGFDFIDIDNYSEEDIVFY